MELTRPDWTLLRTLSGLCQKAGVARERLAAVLIKELVDNALDAAGDCQFGLLPDSNGFWIEDLGPGFRESPREIAHRFSVSRDLLSSKLWRKPKRGCLGHGLRLIAGACLATEGRLIVQNRQAEVLLIPRADGRTDWKIIGAGRDHGCRIEVYLGPSMPLTEASLEFGRKALLLNQGQQYKGKTQFQWYCSESFLDLCRAAEHLTIDSLVRQFSLSLSLKKSLKQYLHNADLSRSTQIANVSIEQRHEIFALCRENSPKFNPKRLPRLGEQSFLGDYHCYQYGQFQWLPGIGTIEASVPFCCEVWTTPLEYGADINVYVNRSPVIWPSQIFQTENSVVFQLNDLRIDIPDKFMAQKGLSLILNIDCPFLPLTSDGKTASFSQFHGVLTSLLTRHLKKIKSHWRKTQFGADTLTTREIFRSHILAAVNQASGQGRFRYSLRQLYYVFRPIVSGLSCQRLNYGYFSRLVTEYENEFGPIKGLYRDARGYLYHPHLRQKLPLGTQFVETYKKPAWTFNKLLYIEKKGLLETLLSVDWPERNDCAIIAAEGHATRADKDLIDTLAASHENLTIYCVHDADAYGTMIFEALQRETRARGARKVRIINLGLDPWEAINLGLEPEIADNKRQAPIADYVSDSHWRNWLQRYRIELNALRPEQFIEWLDYKMKNCSGKVVPPNTILEDKLKQLSQSIVRKTIREELKIDRFMDDRIDDAWSEIEGCYSEMIRQHMTQLPSKVSQLCAQSPEKLWLEHVESIARQITSDVRQLRGREFMQLESLDWIRRMSKL